MNLFALIGAALIGVSLGLLGSGGAIITIPILVYLAGHAEKAAIAESLAIVGAIALFGAIMAAREKRVQWRAVIFFGVPGLAGTFLGSVLAGYAPGSLQVALLGLVMLLAAAMMGRRPEPRDGERPPAGRVLLAAQGAGVGALTGFTGVGGGFLIVPALVLLGGLEMRRAVGTSLAIIALNCAVGFAKHLPALEGHGQRADWAVIGAFAALGVLGSLAGSAIGGKVKQSALRQAFAVFLVLMAGFILWRQIPRIRAEMDANNTEAIGAPDQETPR